MAQYITDLDVSIDAGDEERLQKADYNKINVNLNKGAGGNNIYLWYKQGSQNPITKVQATFNDKMAGGLTSAGYTKINRDLNAGAKGDRIYLWYYKGSGVFDTPIVEVDVTADAESDAHKLSLGWERLTCDLNRRAAGNWIHVVVKRENQTYICDVAATDSYASNEKMLKDGYIRMDEDTNRDAGGSDVFIWYRQTTNRQRALTDLQVSTDDTESQSLKQHNYDQVSVNLNTGTGGNKVYLWHKKEGGKQPIKAMVLLLQPEKADVYQSQGVTVIKRNLNTGTDGWIEYLCYLQ
ncbi:uncharacterized protein si:dkey-30j10.5 [Acanthopagrus latus]|uniref:uncharacterized protein si:dkey-30j10.5 n=1 Tax=Acanthopagrus latus TaxID=8177 RepID=UPI00187BD26C|nr:uncharacterized protein si:dkey-30j10.5 [Acanthopagrus latus]